MGGTFQISSFLVESLWALQCRQNTLLLSVNFSSFEKSLRQSWQREAIMKMVFSALHFSSARRKKTQSNFKHPWPCTLPSVTLRKNVSVTLLRDIAIWIRVKSHLTWASKPLRHTWVVSVDRLPFFGAIFRFCAILGSWKRSYTQTDLQGALAGGGQGQRQVHEGFKGPGLAVASHALHRGLELALEQSHDDGLIQQLVFAPGQVRCCLIIQVVVVLLLVPFPVVRLKTSGGK